MGKESPLTQIAKRTGVNIVAEGIKQLLLWSLPFILTAATVVAGYFQSLPWMYIIVASTFVFAAMATGALRFSELRARITA